MGIFGKKTKKKNKVSFDADVQVKDSLKDTKEKAPTNYNSMASSSSSSPTPRIEQGSEGAMHQKIAPSGGILRSFRGPKPLNSTPSLSSEIEYSNHQSPKNDDEADFMEDSDDNIDDTDHMIDDLQNDDEIEPKTPSKRIIPELETPAMKRQQDSENTNTISNYSIGTSLIPSAPDLENKSESTRANNRDGTQKVTNLSGSSSTDKVQNKNSPFVISSLNNKNNHDTTISYQSSAESISSRSNPVTQEDDQMKLQEQQQQQQQYQQQLQQQQQQQQQLQEIEYYRQKHLQHEIQSEQTRDLVKVFIGEIWNRGEIESIQKVCSPRLRFNGHTGLERVGHEGFSRMVTTVRSSLEGYHCEIHSMVVEGRKCFCRLKFTGKHVGELMGYPPTYKLVAWMGASEFTICPRKKQILKVWELGDIKTLEAQLMS